jgi:hypothetical protein
MSTEWMDSILSGKVNKEAELISQGENAADHFERKVQAHDWIKGVSELDPEAVEKEYQAKLAEEAKMLGKTAAYEMGETPKETIEKDYARDVKILSDYALAEMLAELRCSKAQNTAEMFSEAKEKAKKEVASSREKAEKALLELVPDHTALDWQKAFERFSKEAKPEEPKEKDLYQPEVPEKAHDFEHPKEEKFKLPTKEEMVPAGNGREANERVEVTKEAVPVIKEAAIEKIAEVCKNPKHGKPCDSKCPACIEECSEYNTPAEKKADEVIQPLKREELPTEVKAEVEGCPVCGGAGEDLGSLGQRDHMRCRDCGIMYSHKTGKCAKCADLEDTDVPSAMEIAETFINGNISDAREWVGGDLNKFMDVMEILGHGSPDGQSFQRLMRKQASKEIKSQVSKADVIKKVAEVQSPWQVIKDAEGNEVIARVEQPKNEKESEEDKKDELQK